MKGEHISDALEFLDDELLSCADEVRRGKRSFFFPVRRWGILAAAACAAVVMVGAVLFPPRVAGDTAMNGMVQEPEFSASSNTGVTEEANLWREVSVNSIILSVPPGWEVEQEVVDGDGSYGMRLAHEGKVITVGYDPGFAVCGTGLEEKNITVAGMEGNAGFYDGSEMWSFITLENDYVIINQAGEGWTREEQDEINAILRTIVCNPHTESHDQKDHSQSEGHHGSSGKHH